MKPIAIFYHCVISGPRIPSEDHAISVVAEQMWALKESRLAGSAQEIHVGVNGGDADALAVCALATERCILHVNGKAAVSELPTMAALRDWAQGKSGWCVLYHHSKGASYPRENTWPDQWRRCQERACVWNWRQCLTDLDRGSDAVGCHWLTPERFPGAVSSPFFGGTFWWARAEYLLELPALAPDAFENRYEAESWIGRRRPYPIITDYHPQWPGPSCAQR